MHEARVPGRPVLYADDGAELLDGVGALFQGGVFFWSELDLDDLFEAAGAEFARDSDVVAGNAVLAFEVDGAGEDLLFVLRIASTISVAVADGA